ncbi:hypothetical protein VNO77_43247 [Canavalia gladiata]|uniref:RRM domain-containing protein n=1 Tax=Canavalia gladiata TaxID=3824 RepID=A0AAN9PPS3_CANGL
MTLLHPCFQITGDSLSLHRGISASRFSLYKPLPTRHVSFSKRNHLPVVHHSAGAEFSLNLKKASLRRSSVVMMSYSRRSRYSPSPSPYKRYSRSVSRSLSRSRSRSRSRSLSRDAENPGNNLYVTGLSPRITKRELEKHFATEGKVIDVHLVVDPWTRESRGFGFVTMESVEEADQCVKYLNRSVLEGRVITVEKAKRRRGRTPTPGRYLGLRTIRARRRTPSYSPRRSPSYSPYRRSYSRSPYSSDRSRSRSYSPDYRRRRSYSPYHYRRRRSYSPYYSRRRPYSQHERRRSYSRSRSPYSWSPVSLNDRSYSPYDSRYESPDERSYRRHSYRSVSRSASPDDRYYGRHRYRSVSRSASPRPRRRSRRSYLRSASPVSRRSYSPSVSPKSRRSHSRSSKRSHRYSKRYSRSPNVSASSRSVSRSNTPGSASPST